MATIALVSKLATRGKLTSVQSGYVMIATFKAIGGYTPDLNDRLERFVREQNPDYLLGVKNANKAFAYVIGLDPMANDPDVKVATEYAKGFSLDGTVSKDAIAGSLMHVLFIEPVGKRLGP